MRREETLWLLTGVNLTLNDLTSPGSRRRLYTKGLVDPSTNPVLLFIRDVCQTHTGPVRDKQLPRAASATDKRAVYVPTKWFSECLNNGEVLQHSLDFCEPETLRYLCQCWCWTNFLMATWEIKSEKTTIRVRRGDQKTRCPGSVEISHRSASFPENTEGLGNRAKGRTWT